MGGIEEAWSDYSVFNKNPGTDFLSAYDPSTGRVKFDYDLSYLLEDGGIITGSEYLEFGLASMDQVIASYENDKDISIGILARLLAIFLEDIQLEFQERSCKTKPQ